MPLLQSTFQCAKFQLHLWRWGMLLDFFISLFSAINSHFSRKHRGVDIEAAHVLPDLEHVMMMVRQMCTKVCRN